MEVRRRYKGRRGCKLERWLHSRWDLVTAHAFEASVGSLGPLYDNRLNVRLNHDSVSRPILRSCQRYNTLRVCAHATPEKVVPKSTAMRSFRSLSLSSSIFMFARSEVVLSIDMFSFRDGYCCWDTNGVATLGEDWMKKGKQIRKCLGASRMISSRAFPGEQGWQASAKRDDSSRKSQLRPPKPPAVFRNRQRREMHVAGVTTCDTPPSMLDWMGPNDSGTT